MHLMRRDAEFWQLFAPLPLRPSLQDLLKIISQLPIIVSLESHNSLAHLLLASAIFQIPSRRHLIPVPSGSVYA